MKIQEIFSSRFFRVFVSAFLFSFLCVSYSKSDESSGEYTAPAAEEKSSVAEDSSGNYETVQENAPEVLPDGSLMIKYPEEKYHTINISVGPEGKATTTCGHK